MLYKDAFKTATRSLTHGKMRSILTMLGIVIGIASVIILMSIGQSAQDLILGQVESIGSNLIIITPGAPANGKRRICSVETAYNGSNSISYIGPCTADETN